MVDFTIPDLTAIAAAIADNTLFEVHRNGQAASEKAAGLDLRDYIAPEAYQSGLYYIPPNIIPGSVFSDSANTLYAAPCLVTRRMTISELGFRDVGTTSGILNQMALYKSDGPSRRPGTLVVATGDITQTATAAVVTAAIAPAAVLPGIYWSIKNQNGASAVVGISGFSASLVKLLGTANAAQMIGTPGGNGAGRITITSAQTYGTWPTDLSGATWTEQDGSNMSLAPTPVFRIS